MPKQLSCLEQERNHYLSVSRVPVAKLPLVSSVLLDGPDVHLAETNGGEDVGGPVAAHEGNGDPADHLEEVVGARHKVEAVAKGDLVVLGAVVTQRGQVEVGPEVGGFSPQPQGGHEVEEQGGSLKEAGGEEEPLPQRSLGRRKGGGGVDEEGEVEAGNEPVIAGVLEQVEQRHGGGGELVDVDGLDFSLEEMQHAQSEHQLLGKRVLKALSVEELLAKENDGVGQKGTQVLENEDGSPGDLRAQVLYKDHRRVGKEIVADSVLGLEHNVLLLGAGSSSILLIGHSKSNSSFGQLGGSAQFGHHRGHRVLGGHLEVGGQTLELGLGGTGTQRQIDHGCGSVGGWVDRCMVVTGSNVVCGRK